MGILRNASGPEADRARKDLVAIFKQENLQVTVETNLFATDFLDVTFDLKSKKYFPYRKPNNSILYVNKESNHPPTVIKQIPHSINQRISDISCNEREFNKAKPMYEEALKQSGYEDVCMKYCENKKKPRKRQRKVIWFNPPFSVNVKTRVGKIFFDILDKNFPSNHKFHRLFNRCSVKLSYSCMPNMGSIIKGHNQTILQDKQEVTPGKTCNCKRQSECPMNGNCLVENIVYKAVVKSPGLSDKCYYGLCATTFKLRYSDHKSSFEHKRHRNKTELSKYVWNLKEQNKQYHVAWSVFRKARPFKEGSTYCDLCVTEKLVIARADEKSCLNKKSEIVSTCRHKSKFYLKNVT